MPLKTCPCNSGKHPKLQFDGRGIPLCYTCSECHERKMSKYNPVILRYYTQEDVDEQIEEDE